MYFLYETILILYKNIIDLQQIILTLKMQIILICFIQKFYWKNNLIISYVILSLLKYKLKHKNKAKTSNHTMLLKTLSHFPTTPHDRLKRLNTVASEIFV